MTIFSVLPHPVFSPHSTGADGYPFPSVHDRCIVHIIFVPSHSTSGIGIM